MCACTTAVNNFANWYPILFMVIIRYDWKPAIDTPIGQNWNHKSFTYLVPVLHSKYLFSGEDRAVCDSQMLTLQMSWETVKKRVAYGSLRVTQVSSEISLEEDKNHIFVTFFWSKIHLPPKTQTDTHPCFSLVFLFFNCATKPCN